MRRKTDAATQQVVLLNGPAGVGKTTAGRCLAAAARNGICVHGDDLKHFVVSRDPDTVQGGLSYVGGAVLADVFLNAGYDLVIFEFIFTQRRHVSGSCAPCGRMSRCICSRSGRHWTPSPHGEAVRPNRQRLGARVAECWRELAAQLDELGVLIDARRPVNEVVQAAHEAVRDGRALLTDERLAA
jgi:hypothetical protein